MKDTITYSWGPDKTPQPILWIVFTTLITSIFSTISNTIVQKLFGVPGPESWLGLSWWGLKNFFIWQPFTYLFVQDSYGQGITGLYLINLFFNLYIIWVMGSVIIEEFGPKSFIKFYVTSGIIAGLVTLAAMTLTGTYSILTGPTPTVLALLIVWTLLYPNSELLIFFTFPVKAKWLTLSIITLMLLNSLSQLDFNAFFFYATGITVGYIWAVGVYGLRSPFNVLSRIEASIGQRLTKSNHRPNSKIIDFNTGKSVESDELFVDRMLAKIAKHGEKALSSEERTRLDKISRRNPKSDS